MHADPILDTIFLVFSGAAVFATLALFARQSLLVSYILLGILLGPWGMGWVAQPELLQGASRMGVIFLLYLLGLNLHPQKLLRQIRPALTVTLGSSALFAVAGGAVAFAFGFSLREALVIGAASTFSSTIIGLKLLPTTQLHHQHMGEVIISILLLQDLLAILLLLAMQAGGGGLDTPLIGIGKAFLALPTLAAIAALVARYVLVPLFLRFDTIHEYVFLVTIGWCLGVAQLAASLGLSMEIGAFVGGVALASSPISTFIAESLKPLRDFFLVLFFFALGATFDLGAVAQTWLPATVLAALLLAVKPETFARLLARAGERPALAREVGVRLGQVSEFSLFVAMVGQSAAVIGQRASCVIQLATLLTFLVSSYLVMLRYPTPIAVSERLRRD